MIKNLYITISLSFIAYLASFHTYIHLFVGKTMEGWSGTLYESLLFFMFYALGSFANAAFCREKLYTALFPFATTLMFAIFYYDFSQFNQYIESGVFVFLTFMSALAASFTGFLFYWIKEKN